MGAEFNFESLTVYTSFFNFIFFKEKNT